MEAAFVHTDVQVYYVSILQGPRVRNSMTNYLIYRSANAPWKIVVVEGRRVGILFNDELVDESVDLLCGDSDSHRLVAHVQGLSPNLAGQANPFDFLLCVDWGYSVCLALKPDIRLS